MRCGPRRSAPLAGLRRSSGSTYSCISFTRKLTLDLFGFHLAPETIYGLLIAWNGVLVMIAELLTALTLRYAPRRVMAFGYVLLGVGFGLNAWAHHIPALLVAMIQSSQWAR